MTGAIKITSNELIIYSLIEFMAHNLDIPNIDLCSRHDITENDFWHICHKFFHIYEDEKTEREGGGELKEYTVSM